MLRYQPAKVLVARLLLCVGLVFLLGAAVNAQDVDDVTGHPLNPPHRQPVNAIAKISVRWAKAWSEKNLEGVLALYAEDAVFLPSTGSRITGRAEIRELFAGALASHSSRLQVTSIVTGQSGNLAYDSGEYEERSPSGDVIPSGSGSYLVVVRRDRKGRWRIVQHMWTDLTSVGGK